MMSRNLVLLCLDTVRRDYFERYATRLSDRADVTFAQCRAASSWSVPSHASMLTGQLPHQHGVHTHNRDFSTIDGSEVVTSDLSDYCTACVSANVFASREYGFDNFFDEFYQISPNRRFPGGMNLLQFTWESNSSGFEQYLEFFRSAFRHEHTFNSLLNGVVAKLNDEMQGVPIPKLWDDGATAVSRQVKHVVREENEPVFLFANYMDAHGPFQHVLGFDGDSHSVPYRWSTNQLETDAINFGTESVEDNLTDVRYQRELYGAAIEYLDREVSALVHWLHESTERETTVVVTADHGENLGFDADNNLLDHTSSLTEGVLHVPFLLMNSPDGYDDVESEYFSHLELPTLIRALSRNETPDVFANRIPAELVGKSAQVDPPSETQEYWKRMIRCVYDRSEKLVWDSLDNASVYELDSTRPCWQREKQEAADLSDWAQDFFDKEISTYKSQMERDNNSEAAMTGASKSRLKELGYL